MSKRLHLSIIIAFLVFISISLYSCTPRFTWKPDPVKTIQAVTYVLPKDENIKINTKDSYIDGFRYGNIHGIQLLLYYGRGGNGYIFSADLEKQNNLLLVERSALLERKRTRYHVKVYVEDKIDSTIINLVPTKKEVFVSENEPIPQKARDWFAEAELMKFLGSVMVNFKIEIDSPYSTASVYANFKRKLREYPLRKPYKDPVTGKIYKFAYLFPYNESEAKLFVEVYPYRDGSKTIITVVKNFTANKTTWNTDLGVQIRDIKQEIAKIVHD